MNKLLPFALAFALPVSWCLATELPPAAAERLDREQIEILVSPIALYPDPLVALILPASTRPSDLVLAARYLERGGNPEDTRAQPWESSVKALVRYGEVITYLDENLAWTQSLGECFMEQPEDIMTAIQTLRARARTAGLLMDTAEQEVIVEEEEIRIVPARPTVIYVPRYDPEVLYVSYSRPYFGGPFLVFGLGYAVGSWLSFDCDWQHRTVLMVQRPVHWYHQPDWRARHVHAGIAPWQRWAPSPQHKRHNIRPARATTEIVLRPSRDWESTRQSRLAATTTRSPGNTRPSTWQRPDDHRSQMISTPPRASRPDVPAKRRDSRMIRETDRPANILSSPAAPAVASARGPSPAVQPPTPGVTHRRSGHEGSSGQKREYRSRNHAPAVETSSAPARLTASPEPAQPRVAADSSPRAARPAASDSDTRPEKSGGRHAHRDLN